MVCGLGCGLSRESSWITSPSLMSAPSQVAWRFRWGSPRGVLSSCAPLRGLTAHNGFHWFYSNPNALQVAAQSRNPCKGQGAVFIDRGLLKSLTVVTVFEYIITSLVMAVNCCLALGILDVLGFHTD